MLYKFKSRSTADIIMLQAHGRQILQAIGKSPDDAHGIVTPEQIPGAIQALEAAHGPCPPLIAARLIAQTALARHESRGGHFRSDYPATDAVGVRTFVTLDGAAPGLRYAAE